MDEQELQEIFEGLLARYPLESSAGHALSFTHQVLTAESREERAQALVWLLNCLASTSDRFPSLLARPWAILLTENGEDNILAFREEIAALRQDRSA